MTYEDEYRSLLCMELWKRSCGHDYVHRYGLVPQPEVLIVSQWNEQFEKLRKNRMVMGALRYGIRVSNEKKEFDSKYAHVDNIIQKANRYLETGNMELLVDIANLAELEFSEPSHSLAHFKATDDQEHTTAK